MNGIITGNFEGHGLSDLVVSLGQYPAGITSLAVLPGDGHGGFLAPVIYSLGVFSPTGGNLSRPTSPVAASTTSLWLGPTPRVATLSTSW